MTRTDSRSRGSRKKHSRQAPKRSWVTFVVLGVLVLSGIVAVFVRPGAARVAQPVQAAPVAAPKSAAPANAAPTAAPQTGSAQPKASVPGNTDRPVVQAQDGVVRVALTDLVGEEAKFYTYEAKGKTIPFFVMRSSDGTIRAAFDACDVCFTFKKGYHQEGDEMVCNNCGSRFPSVKINEVKGGCNPSPLERTVQGDSIVIKASDLQSGAQYF